MKPPQRGEIWLVDLGLAAKVRPALVMSVPPSQSDRALVTLVPHTTSLRGSRFEVPFQVPFLRPGGFNAQGLITIPSPSCFAVSAGSRRRNSRRSRRVSVHGWANTTPLLGPGPEHDSWEIVNDKRTRL